MKFENVKQVAQWRMCLGCGACKYACPEGKIKLVDVVMDGIRPDFDTEGCNDCSDCVAVCPGHEINHQTINGMPGQIGELKDGWGVVLEVWEGHASDNEIRKDGSSGGLASALALYCLEHEKMHGALHTGSSSEFPLKNTTFMSKNRADILSRTGSRYLPASPCDELIQIESAPDPCVFIGKPCDVAGLRKAQSLKAALDEKVGVAIGIFCAGTPSTNGTLELLKKLKVEPGDVGELRYRGKGWPGETTVKLKGRETPSFTMSYQESWGFLQKYRPWRCYLCPDGTAELADISCGDPWYRDLKDNETGSSLVLVRTEKGRRILHGAIAAGYASMERVDPGVLERSQKNLLSKRKTVWGRLTAMKLFFIPAPRYTGFPLFRNWLSLPINEKIRSVLGTVRRIISRGYYKRLANQGMKLFAF